MQPSDYTSTMRERELAALLYRDHIGLKHADRSRLCEELEEAKTQETQKVLAVTTGEQPQHGEEGEPRLDPLRKALLDHIWEVGGPGGSVPFS